MKISSIAAVSLYLIFFVPCVKANTFNFEGGPMSEGDPVAECEPELPLIQTGEKPADCASESPDCDPCVGGKCSAQGNPPQNLTNTAVTKRECKEDPLPLTCVGYVTWDEYDPQGNVVGFGDAEIKRYPTMCVQTHQHYQMTAFSCVASWINCWPCSGGGEWCSWAEADVTEDKRWTEVGKWQLRNPGQGGLPNGIHAFLESLND